jgi:hypothetical protein
MNSGVRRQPHPSQSRSRSAPGSYRRRPYARLITGRMRFKRAREACDKLICTAEVSGEAAIGANPQNYKCGLASSDGNIARIERAEVLLSQDRAAVFRRLEVEVDEFMHGATMQET